MEAEEAQDKLNAVQNSIFSANEEMDRFKLQMNWNQEELEQWALAAKQKEEDNLALQKYARADDVKIKELRYTTKCKADMGHKYWLVAVQSMAGTKSAIRASPLPTTVLTLPTEKAYRNVESAAVFHTAPEVCGISLACKLALCLSARTHIFCDCIKDVESQALCCCSQTFKR